MKLYEGLFILSPDATPEVQKTQVDRVEECVKKFGGVVTEKLELGRKPLGYPLKKFREGALWGVNFQLDSIKANELRKALELQEDLLKYMITVKDVRPVKVKKVSAPKPAVQSKAQPAAAH